MPILKTRVAACVDSQKCPSLNAHPPPFTLLLRNRSDTPKANKGSRGSPPPTVRFSNHWLDPELITVLMATQEVFTLFNPPVAGWPTPAITHHHSCLGWPAADHSRPHVVFWLVLRRRPDHGR